MFARIRWVLIAVGVLVIALGGASIFSLPDHQVLYDAPAPLVTCTTKGCISIYTLEIGNTGRQVQDDVRVRLHAAAARASMLPVSVRTFGKVPRAVRVHDDDRVRTYDLGAVKPQERVEVQLVFQGPDAPRDWQAILVAVEAAAGEVRQGNPGGILLGRLLYSIFGAGWG
jgi:hypothetical protein